MLPEGQEIDNNHQAAHVEYVSDSEESQENFDI